MTTHIDNPRARRRNRWSLVIWGTAGFLLLLPAVAMQFTGEVNWTASDFVFMGVLLSLACGTYEVVARMTSNTAYRAGVGVAVLTGFLTVWVNAAVGMLGSEDNLANLLFFGVLGVGVVGAILAWFKPRGMAIAMGATAAAQAAMAVYALFGGYAEVTVHVAAFAVPWLVSAQLFRKAAREMAEPAATDGGR